MGRAPEARDSMALCASLRPSMSRRSLRPQLNQIRGWVRQGRTDAWIAHQLEVTVQQIQAFKREQGLEPDAEANGAPPLEEVDLRAEDDAQIAAELEAGGRAQGRGGGRAPPRRPRARPPRRRPRAAAEAEEPTTRRSPSARRAAPRRALAPARRARGPLEGTFDHGEEGYGLWLDPAVAGRPRLRRALGGPPSRRDHDRGGPDRDPPRRRRRGRRRRLIAAPRCRDRLARAQDSLRAMLVEPWEHGSGPAHAVARRTSGTRTSCASRATRRRSDPTRLVRAADALLAGLAPPQSRSRTRPLGDAAARRLRRCGLESPSRHRLMRARGRADAALPSRRSPLEPRPLRLEWYARGLRDTHEAPGRRWPSAQDRRASRAARRCARSWCAVDGGSRSASRDARGRGDGRRRDRAALRDAARRADAGIGAAARRRPRSRAGGRERGVRRRRRRGRSRSASTRGSGSRPSGASTRSVRRHAARALSAIAPAAGEVGRAAQVAAEGGVGDDARVPGERLVGRDRDREVGRTSRCPRRRGRRARRS